MRVICDNCEAVYKIADEKLVKEINRATCKRCGNKIVIYRPGSGKNPAPPVAEAEQPVSAPSGPDLERLAQMTHGGGLPSLGSLTAELRAISVPGVEAAAPAEKPANLGPSDVSGDTVAPEESVPSGLPSDSPSAPSSPPPVVAPAQGIPPSEGPSTKVYKGPAPMTASVPSVSVEQSPQAYAQPVAPPPTPSISVSQPMAAVPGPNPAIQPGADSSHTSVTTIAHDGTQVMGTIGTLGVFGFIGLVLNIFFGGMVGALGAGMAGFATFGCLSVSLLTQKGRRPGRTPIALVLSLFLGLMMTALAFLLPGQVADVAKKQSSAPAPAPPAVESKPASTEATSPSTDESSPESMAEAARAAEAAGLFGGLSADETEELNRVDSQPPAPAPSPAPAPAAAAQPERRKAAPKPRAEPRSSSASRSSDPPRTASRTSGSSRSSSRSLSGPRRANTSSKPPASPAPKSSGGPSPFVIDTIIRNNATIMRCVRAEEARGTDLSGKIYLKFTLDPSGKTSRARVSTSRFAGTALDTCISKELNALEFPAFSGKPKNITYPFVVQ